MSKSPYRARSVLVVDDQEFVLNIVTTMLKQIGFGEIETRTDGTAALEALEQKQPDLIICDINMKPMDGLAFLSTMRNSDKAYAHSIPVIFLTAEVSQNLMTRAADLECDMFLLKPVSPQKLLEKINQVFGADEFS